MIGPCYKLRGVLPLRARPPLRLVHPRLQFVRRPEDRDPPRANGRRRSGPGIAQPMESADGQAASMVDMFRQHSETAAHAYQARRSRLIGKVDARYADSTPRPSRSFVHRRVTIGQASKQSDPPHPCAMHIPRLSPLANRPATRVLLGPAIPLLTLALNFACQKSGRVAGFGRIGTSFMTVPEAAMHETDSSEPTEDQVRCSRELPIMKTVPETARVQCAAKRSVRVSYPFRRFPPSSATEQLDQLHRSCARPASRGKARGP